MGRMAVVMAACVWGLGCAKASSSPTALERGELLVRVGGCTDCHTPQKFDEALGAPVPDLERRFSGHPEGAPDPQGSLGPQDQAIIGPTFTSFRLPFGVVYAANLSSDRETGLGGWTEAQFVKAMKTGKHAGEGRAVLPPMPWAGLSTLEDSDLAAMYAYFLTVPAVRNRVPEPKVEPAVLEKMGKVNEAMRRGR